ncbi:Uncharacterised protein [Bordetella pertussis]|nr:Uncharacterised protein [Bordetella pertussis]CFW33409.1 Uncharacterised protein [Bordetella pertussis]
MRAVTSGASTPMCWPLCSRSRRATIWSAFCGSTATLQSGQYWVPSLTYSRRRK